MNRQAAILAALSFALAASPARIGAQAVCGMDGACHDPGQAEQVEPQPRQEESHDHDQREEPKPPPAPAKSPFLTNEQFDAEMKGLQDRLASAHEGSADRIQDKMKRVHDEFHDERHQAKPLGARRPPSGGVLVTKEEMGLLEQTADAKISMIKTSLKVQRRQAPVEQLVKAQEIFQAKMDEFMKTPSPLHDAYHKSYDRDPQGDNGLGGAPPSYQRDHNRRMRDNDPGNPFPLIFSGNAELADGNPAAAKKFADRALALDPGNADALSLRAAAQMDLKDYRAASEDAKKALELDPTDQRSQAVVMLAHDRVAEGFSIQKHALNPPPDESGLLAFGRAAGAAPTAALAGGALQANVLVRQTERAIALGDYQAAMAQASRAIGLDPTNGSALALRAMAHLRAGEHEAAAKDAVAALSLNGKNMLAHNVKADAHNRDGRYRDALAAAEAAIAAEPGNAYAYYMKAMALNGLDDRAGMEEALSRAAALDARYQDALALARQAPDDEDLGFLFPEENLAAARAALAKRVRAPRSRGMTLALIVGAALILFGSAQFLLGGAAGKIKNAYARATRVGPGVGLSETVVGLPMPPPLSTIPDHASLLRGQFRTLRLLGAGPRGEVFEGLDVSLDRRVAIRRLAAPLRADDRQRLLAPARQAAALSHPNIAGLYSIIEDADSIHLVVELAEGRPLKEALALGALPQAKALPLLRQAAQALDYAHARGVAHGAIRPSNIFITPDGQLKLVDFGLAPGAKGKTADLADFAHCLRQVLGAQASFSNGRAMSATQLVDALADSDVA